MYDYRKMTLEERQQIVEARQQKRQPWHSPPHLASAASITYLVTAACYEHVAIIGQSPERMGECEEGVLKVCAEDGTEVHAWCILPNHYHLLVRTVQIKALLKALGQFHGRSSYTWNGADEQRGRHCWYNAFERYMRSERHFFASLNYVHNNPVHHGYTGKWLDWPWSSATTFLEQTGRDVALRLWREYPLLDYGKKWDVY